MFDYLHRSKIGQTDWCLHYGAKAADYIPFVFRRNFSNCKGRTITAVSLFRPNPCSCRVWQQFYLCTKMAATQQMATLYTLRFYLLTPGRCYLENATFNITVTPYWARWRLTSPASRLVTPLFVQAHIKGIITAPRHWLLWGLLRGPVNSPHKRPVTRKKFPFDDVIMNLAVLKALDWCLKSSIRY